MDTDIADTRVSDAERERAAEQLRAAVGTGRLDLAGYDERLRTAYAAITRAELARVTADLPVPVGAARPSRPSARPVPTEWARAWRAWLGGALIMIGIWAATSLAKSDVTGFWPAIPVGIWAAFLVAHMVSGRAPHHGGCAGRRS